MKQKPQDRTSGRRAIAFIASLVVLTAIAVAATIAYNKLRDLWLEQCVVRDVTAQIEITTGNRVKADTVREMFGLRNGANLALIDFAAKREEALKSQPAIKSIAISRKLPDGLVIAVTERSPFAKLNLKGGKRDTGRVCDEDGVVFSCRRGAEMLPIIREADAPGTPPGARLENRANCALILLKTVRDPEFSDLGILEIDVSRPDFLLITLTNYSLVKFCWTGMDGTAPDNAELRQQLKCVSKAIATNLQPGTKIWNATQPGIATADPNGIN